MIRSCYGFCLLMILCFYLWNPDTGYSQVNEAVHLDTMDLKNIFEEPLLAGKRPDFLRYSYDQSGFYMQWNDSAYSSNERYYVDLNSHEPERSQSTNRNSLSLSPEDDKLTYIQNGDIWLADTGFTNSRRLLETSEPEYNPTWSPDGNYIAFSREGEIWAIQIDPYQLIQVTVNPEDLPDNNIVTWLDNEHLIIRQEKNSDKRTLYFPEYLGKFVQPGKTKRGIPNETLKVISISNKKEKKLHEGKAWLRDISSGPKGRFLAFNDLDPVMKNRKIKVYDLKRDTIYTVWHDSTDGWINYKLTRSKFAPDSSRLLVMSERSGWNHLYSIDVQESNPEPVQLTQGNFKISWAEWLSNDKVIYSSSQVGPGERHIYIRNLNNETTQKLTDDPGFRNKFYLSDDHNHLVYEKSYFNKPFELYHIKLAEEARKEERITRSIPERFSDIDWQREEYIKFSSSDGSTELSMSLLNPVPKDTARKYPLIVFVHGAGSLQNVYKGWSENYFREYMFHQWLTHKGYAIIEVDYRHSTGYGRDFREDVTNWLGKHELQDIIDGIDLVAKRSYIDTSRVGIYGGSYGGFLTLYGLSKAPGYFDAGAALRAVTDWENYYYANPWYTLPRLGRPKENPEHYKRSSPISYADSMDKPVLILHGLKDNNVGFQSAAQYIERLIQGGNTKFRMMMYPSERHSFDNAASWYDEYRRIYEYFEEYVK